MMRSREERLESIASLQGIYEDVEIRIFEEDSCYYAEMTAGGRRYGSELTNLPGKGWEGIAKARDYGSQVFRWLFPPGSDLEKGFVQARWKIEEDTSEPSFALDPAADLRTGRLRLRLWLDPDSEALHRVWWEAMYDPHRDSEIAMSTALSRFITSDMTPALPVGQRPIRMLMVTSNPPGLDRFGCAPLNTRFEQDVVRSATRGLGESLSLEHAADPSADDLGGYIQKLEPHIVYLQAHSIYTDSGGELLLAGGSGSAEATPFGRVVQLIAQSTKMPPRLVFLAVPATARPNDRFSLPMLGRALVESGVQASVALQGLIEPERALAFSAHFFAVLTRKGVIDEAVSSARARIYDQGPDWCWTFPVLYMKTPDAVLFQPLPREIEDGIRAFSRFR